MILIRFLLLALLLATTQGCALFSLAGYAISPDYPVYEEGDTVDLPGLQAPVQVVQRDDGLWHIHAANNEDAFRVQGYLQARDRMFQLDLLRHVAQGRAASLLGVVEVAGKTTLDVDKFNRFLGLAAQAQQMADALPEEERKLAQAGVDGINAWIAEDKLSIEHRLLGVDEIEPWTLQDSFSIFRLFMFGLTHNYTREARRLLLACSVGLEGMERVWPSDIEFDAFFLPPDSFDDSQTWQLAPAVVPELAEALAGLCPTKTEPVKTAQQQEENPVLAALAQLGNGIEASNNWVLGGALTASGKPIVANDPHLPQMNPPVVWGVHMQTPEIDAAGFTLVGLHRITMGVNNNVAWGGTINNVDLQDLFVLKPMTQDGVAGYEFDGAFEPFEVREETFMDKAGNTRTLTARYTRFGPLLNDLDPFLQDRIPLTALAVVSLEGASDAEAGGQITVSRNAAEFVKGVDPMDSACISWVYADTAGDFGWTSPCRVPVRKTWRGTFPAPGWLSKYTWDGLYDKKDLPASHNPARGWIATSNNRPLPAKNWPTAYNNDPSSPNRYLTIAEQLQGWSGTAVSDSEKLHMNTTISFWDQTLETLDDGWCDVQDQQADIAFARKALCDWDGTMEADSVTATVYVLLTHAALDLGLADELPGGADSALWTYIQNIAHFEQNVEYALLRDNNDTVWDDMHTEAVETKTDIFNQALALAVATGTEKYGDDLQQWRWGIVRPFVLKHLFGGKSLLAPLFNAPPLPGAGAPNTVFKNQFVRSDREHMHPGAGPALRFVVDMADPKAAVFTLAGGNSGWPSSPYYANLLPEWRYGKYRPLFSTAGVHVTFNPSNASAQE